MKVKELELKLMDDGTIYLNHWSIYGNDLVLHINPDGKVFRHTWKDEDADEPIEVATDLLSELRKLIAMEDGS